MIAEIFVVLILPGFQCHAYRWVKSAISECSFSWHAVEQHLHHTPACKWDSSAHTTFFIVAILLSADEVLHRLAIWVAPKRSCLKEQSADSSVVIPQIDHSYLIVCFTSKFSVKISYILIQRIVLKNIFRGAHRQGVMPRVGQNPQAWEGPMNPRSRMEKQGLRQNQVTTHLTLLRIVSQYSSRPKKTARGF